MSRLGGPRARGRQRTRPIASEPADIVVKSIADAKGKDRFYTSIRLPRELWDRAGFGPDDRLLLDWSGTGSEHRAGNRGRREAKVDRQHVRGSSVMETGQPQPRPPQRHRHGRLPALDEKLEADVRADHRGVSCRNFASARFCV